ncbi:MAG: Hsp70 family protein [Firmicutes bacterium]|nr:Hsp70 family protein [Bacillota bacterium]
MYLGIDLGTTYSAVAWINGQGEAEIIENREGERVTPSVVYFQPDGEVLVGAMAKEYVLLDPDRVITTVKDDMGTDRVYEIDGVEYRPEDISALILKKLVQDAEERMGEKVERLVVTIPAYFNDAQRVATMDAIRMAGLHCDQMINEPTAAALSYAQKNDLGDGTILVYDLGGGTFDVSLICQQGETVKVLATGGHKDLGGHFFDALICDSISDQLLDEGIDLEFDPAYAPAMQELMLKAEQCKKRLSTLAQGEIDLMQVMPPKRFKITKEEYEGMILPFCMRTENKVRQVMEDAGLTFDDLSRVLLVGGSSRTPLVQKRLAELCGKEPSKNVNPDEAVALGAALCAAKIKTIEDVCSRSIGVVTYDVRTDSEQHRAVIQRNSQLPAEGEKLFCTASQTDRLMLKISEAEDNACDLNRAVLLNDYGIPLGRTVPEGTQVKVKMRLDENQILKIWVELDKPFPFREEYRLDRRVNLEERDRIRKTAIIADIKVN